MENSITASSSTELWNSLHNELLRHFKLIKNICLLGHDEFIPSFITNTWNILDKTPTEHTTKEINIIFQNIIRNIMPNDRTVLDYFYFDVPSINEDSSGKNGWDVITLRYQVPEQFTFLFNDEIFNIYNTIFRYLLKVNKAKASSLNFISTRLFKRQTHGEVEMLIMNLHTIFAILIGYLRNVFDSQYALMESFMTNAKNFEDVQATHSTFLSSIISRSFLPTNYNANSNEPESYFLQELLKYYDDFVILKLKWDFKNHLDPSAEEVKILYDRFNSIKNLAITTMKSINCDEFSSEYLRTLILSFEFNLWGDKTDEVVNLDKFLQNLHV
ncbi:hypothetical protein PV326_012425 [Microctonus aethiopoides]|nr:hypothetical protein PV326_012425 [Microctonus aethiopoides]